MNSLFKYFALISTLQVLLLCTSQAQAPQFDWVRTFGAVSVPTVATSATSLVVDANKAVIVTGAFHNTVDFDGGPGVFNLTSNGSTDIYITKYDTAGNFIWAKKLRTCLCLYRTCLS